MKSNFVCVDFVCFVVVGGMLFFGEVRQKERKENSIYEKGD